MNLKALVIFQIQVDCKKVLALEVIKYTRCIYTLSKYTLSFMLSHNYKLLVTFKILSSSCLYLIKAFRPMEGVFTEGLQILIIIEISCLKNITAALVPASVAIPNYV